MAITAAALIAAATWLAWGYLFSATDHSYVADELKFAIDLDEATIDLNDPPSVLIVHNVEPSWESIVVMMPGEEIGASIDISLEAGTHPGAQWHCTSNAPLIRGEIGSAWSPLITDQRHEVRNFNSDKYVSARGRYHPQPAVMCQRQGDSSATYGQGRVSLAPATITHTHNTDAEIGFQAWKIVNVPAAWERDLLNQSYAFTEEGDIGEIGVTDLMKGQPHDPEVDWIDTRPLFFINTEKKASAERNAWMSALIGGLGFGLIPPILFRSH